MAAISSTTGIAYSNLEEAIAATAAGGTITLTAGITNLEDPGLADGFVTITKSLTITGAGPGVSFLEPVVDNLAGIGLGIFAGSAIQVSGGADVFFKNFTFDGRDDGNGNIRLSAAFAASDVGTSIFMDNMFVQNVGLDAPASPAGSGLYISEGADGSVNNSTFRDLERTGIITSTPFAVTGASVNVTNSHFIGQGPGLDDTGAAKVNYGVEINFGTSGQIQGSTFDNFQGNAFGITSAGVISFDGNSVTVGGSTFTNNTAGIVVQDDVPGFWVPPTLVFIDVGNTFTNNPEGGLVLLNIESANVFGETTIGGPGGNIVYDAFNLPAGQNFTGTDLGDALFGSNTGGDVLSGAGGDDVIVGRGGNDDLRGNAGNDDLFGDANDDTLTGGTGDDDIDGGTGIDTAVFAGSFFAYTFTVDQVSGTVHVVGPDGSDNVLANVENYRFAEGDFTRSQILLVAGPGTGVTQNGGVGPDILIGTGANDTQNGGAGNDILQGLAGNDVQNGGAGNDDLFGGDGLDTMNGDAGNDNLYGGEGADTMDGGGDNDFAYGGGGDDAINGGDGNDNLHGDGGNDTINGGAGNDDMQGDGGNDTMNGGDGNDFVGAGPNGAGPEGDGNDIIDGGTGDDTLNAGNGDDIVRGGDGTDRLSGGNGQDILDGGAGADFLLGDLNPGGLPFEDTFVLRAGQTAGDVIADFQAGLDHLVLAGFVSVIQNGNGTWTARTAGGATETFTAGNILAADVTFTP